MRIARKLLLLALAAIAAMMMTTASASAVEVTNEHTGAHCSPGCLYHASGEIELRGHLFGIEVTASDCNVELGGTLDEDGAGAVNSASYTDHAGVNDCTRTPCGLPWALNLTSGLFGGVNVTMEWCFQPSSGSASRCLITINVVFSLPASAHLYELWYGTSTDTGGVNHAGADCELAGEIDLESSFASSELEIQS